MREEAEPHEQRGARDAVKWPAILPTWAYDPTNGAKLVGEISAPRSKASRMSRAKRQARPTNAGTSYLHAAHQFFRPKTDVRVKADRSARRQAAIKRARAAQRGEA